jgi:hypothetical protein
MPTTTNYGWTTPADTDLVKDGASAIRTLGTSVDTTVKALSPGTTSGDLDYYTAATTKARIGIGTNGQVLTSNGSVPSWSTPTAGGLTQLATGTLSGVEVSLTSISQAYKDLLLIISGPYVNTATYLAIRINNVTTASYTNTNVKSDSATPSNSGGLASFQLNTGTSNLSTSVQTYQSTLQISNYSFAGYKTYNFTMATDAQSASGPGWAPTNAAVTSIQIRTGNGTSTFTGGTYKLFGVN